MNTPEDDMNLARPRERLKKDHNRRVSSLDRKQLASRTTEAEFEDRDRRTYPPVESLEGFTGWPF